MLCANLIETSRVAMTSGTCVWRGASANGTAPAKWAPRGRPKRTYAPRVILSVGADHQPAAHFAFWALINYATRSRVDVIVLTCDLRCDPRCRCWCAANWITSLIPLPARQARRHLPSQIMALIMGCFVIATCSRATACAPSGHWSDAVNGLNGIN